jgi:hypothetical protein
MSEAPAPISGTPLVRRHRDYDDFIQRINVQNAVFEAGKNALPYLATQRGADLRIFTDLVNSGLYVVNEVPSDSAGDAIKVTACS